MILNNPQIITHISNAINQIAAESDQPEHKNLIEAINAALRELKLRSDAGYYRDYCERGARLIAGGISLLSSKQLATLPFSADLLPSVNASAGVDEMGETISEISAQLGAIVKTIGLGEHENELNYLESVCAWEGEIYARRNQSSFAHSSETNQHNFRQDKLEQYLQERFPDWRQLKVKHLEVLSGGFSKLTILLTTADGLNGEQSLVIRANQLRRNIKIDGANIVNEFPLLQYTFEQGIPVAEPLLLERDRQFAGTEFCISRRASGHILGSAHTNAEAAEVTTDVKTGVIRTLLKIHGLPIDGNSKLVKDTFLSSWHECRTMKATGVATANFWYEEGLRHNVAMTPRLQRIYDWLIANASESRCHPVLIHGDYGFHNLLMEGDQVQAVLDWEIAKIGDPAEEFTSLFMSLGVEYDEEILRLYQDLGGQPISLFRIYYYRIVMALRAICFNAAALNNLCGQGAPDMNLYIWMLGSVDYCVGNINELISKAEKLKSEDF